MTTKAKKREYIKRFNNWPQEKRKRAIDNHPTITDRTFFMATLCSSCCRFMNVSVWPADCEFCNSSDTVSPYSYC